MSQAHVACAKHPSPGSQPKKTAPQYVELSSRTRHPRLFWNEHFTRSSSKESAERKGLIKVRTQIADVLHSRQAVSRLCRCLASSWRPAQDERIAATRSPEISRRSAMDSHPAGHPLIGRPQRKAKEAAPLRATSAFCRLSQPAAATHQPRPTGIWHLLFSRFEYKAVRTTQGSS